MKNIIAKLKNIFTFKKLINKGMTFEQARTKLKKISKGDYITMSYGLSEQLSKDHPSEVKCTVYLNKYSHNSAPTWEEAFEKLELEMNPKPKEVPNMNQAPQ